MAHGLRVLLTLALLASVAVFSPAVAEAQTVLAVTVASDQCLDPLPGSLREAINNANDGIGPQEIVIDVDGPIVLQCVLPDLTGNITIRNANDDQVVIQRVDDSDERFRIFTIAAGSDITLEGLHLTNGLTDNGGGVHVVDATLTVVNSTIAGNTVVVAEGDGALARGGGIFAEASRLVVTGSTISDNVVVVDTDYDATVYGAGIYVGGSNASIEVTNSIISDNVGVATAESTAYVYGAGIYVGGSNASIEVVGSTIVDNVSVATTPSEGSNQTTASGGGIFSDATQVTIARSRIAGNVVVADTDGIAPVDASGGGISSNAGSIAITGSTIAGNTVSSNGFASFAYGGGIDVFGARLEVTASTIAGNIVDGSASGFQYGGGISLVGGDLAMSNSTVTENMLSREGTPSGSGIYLAGPGYVWDITSSTIITEATGYSASSSGISMDARSETTISGSIIVSRSGSNACDGPFTDGGYNLSNDSTCLSTVTSLEDIALDDGLADNGGPTETIMLLPDSVAIDAIPAGHPLCAGTDQRGISRPQGVACDIGSVERQQDTQPPELPEPPEPVEGPTLNIPDRVVVETLDPDGAIVAWEATATDDAGNDLPVNCTIESGSFLAVGTYGVTCEATDRFGQEVSGTFTVEVVYVGEMVPPRISPVLNTNIPAAGPDGTIVIYPLSVWSPLDPNPIVVCVPPSGSLFPIGTTTVTCTATDRFGNASSITFSITIFVPEDVEPGPLPSLTLPGDLVVNATSPEGADVSYAVGASSGSTVICSPAPDSVMPIGTTTVTCTATGGDGQTTSGSFEIRVLGAMEQLRILIDDVASEDEDAAVPLVYAAIALNRGWDERACGLLEVFTAQVGDGSWADDARRIQDVIGCE